MKKLDLHEATQFPLPLCWQHATHDWMLQAIIPRARNHYNLLGYLAALLGNDGEVILDLGTSTGLSALAILDGVKTGRRNCRIASFDIAGNEIMFPLQSLGVSVSLEGAEGCFTQISLASLIMLDISHNGKDEQAVVDLLLEHGFRGVLVMDDISHPAIKPLFEAVKKRKYDVTPYFHHTGTGIVDFSNNLVVVEQSGAWMLPTIQS